MLTIEHAGGGQHGTGHDLTAVPEGEALVSAVDGDGCNFKRGQKFRAEALRLRERAAREFAAADAGRKSKVVFDART